RALKQTLQMDILRCRTPEMVRKEIWAHLLAYNLIRSQMATVAKDQQLLPVQLSFKGAVQAVQAFAGWLWTAGADQLGAVCQRLRAVIASYVLEERPNRCEPRARKRRPKQYPLLTQPRRKKETGWPKELALKSMPFDSVALYNICDNAVAAPHWKVDC